MAPTINTLSCYVSVPIGVNTNGLRRALAKLDVSVSKLDELSPAGSNFVSIIEEEMRAADFVCVVLGREVANSNVLFELGLAAGLGRPVLIVAEDRNALPAALNTYPVVQASANNIEALSFQLKIFLHDFRQSAGVVKSHQLTRRFRLSLGHVQAVEMEGAGFSTAEGSEFERLIWSALKGKGLEVVAQVSSERSDEVFRPDFAVWFPESPPDIGNPIIIEAKKTNR